MKKNIKEKEAHNSIVNSNPSLGLNDPQFRKVLSMNWDVVRDKFRFSFEEICEFAMKLPFTKRNA